MAVLKVNWKPAKTGLPMGLPFLLVFRVNSAWLPTIVGGRDVGGGGGAVVETSKPPVAAEPAMPGAEATSE